jgi:hypothetical protein
MDILIKLEKAKNDDKMDDLGFICLDTAIHILGDISEDPNVWIWQNSQGMRIAMYDEGEGKCSFIRVVRPPIEGLKKYVNAGPKDMISV